MVVAEEESQGVGHVGCVAAVEVVCDDLFERSENGRGEGFAGYGLIVGISRGGRRVAPEVPCLFVCERTKLAHSGVGEGRGDARIVSILVLDVVSYFESVGVVAELMSILDNLMWMNYIHLHFVCTKISIQPLSLDIILIEILGRFQRIHKL